MTGRLEGKRCLVTGGGSGIGRAVALRYAEEGAKVVVSGRRAEACEETAAGSDAITICSGDVASADDARRIVETVVERHGGLDVVFHAAGVLRRNERLEETDEATWRFDVDVNLTGTYLLCRAAIPALRESRGTLILVASQLAHIASPETDMAYIGRDFAAMRDTVAAGIPLRRVGTPEDMAGPAVFLASDDAAWVTGHSLVVDGGFTVQ